MSEKWRIELQNHYMKTCVENGLLDVEANEKWPGDPEQRVEMARKLYGVTIAHITDSMFNDVRLGIGAENFEPIQRLKEAMKILNSLGDEQKSALMTLIEDVLEGMVYSMMIRIDRFEHGRLELHHFMTDDEEGCDIDGSEVNLTSFSCDELFQEAVDWRISYSMGEKIGRPDDIHGIKNAAT